MRPEVATALDGARLNQVTQTVHGVPDPELGDVTIGELGMVRSLEVSLCGVSVELVPTFLGCPARSVIEAHIRQLVGAETDVPLTVRWVSAPWTESMISQTGIEKLARLGIAVGDAGCPLCSGKIELVGGQGPTSCRSVGRCVACGEIVEVMRGAGSPLRFGSKTYANV
jgi:ring-1,2-phenylacetyl-CoA epoxidase subunit PaaD